MTDRKDIEGSAPEGATGAVFSAVLTPHRSLGPGGFLLLMLVVGATSFLAGLVFWLAGAWPVLGFMGLDVALVYLAFRLNYSAAKALEEIELTQAALIVRKIDARGRSREFRFQPYWARLEVDRDVGRRVTALRIASHGRRLRLGRFLTADDLAGFASALDDALKSVRLGRIEPDPPARTG